MADNNDPMRRAKNFAKSQRVIDLISRAKSHGIIVEISGLRTSVQVKKSNGESVHTTTWQFDTDDAEDFVYMFLEKRIDSHLYIKRLYQ